MTKIADKQCAALLTSLGFASESRQTWIHWRWKSQATQNTSLKSDGSGGGGRLITAWSIDAFELAERKGQLTVHRLDARLDRTAFRANLSLLTKRYFGVRTSSEIVEGRNNELWCLFEFQRPGSRDRDGSNETVREDVVPFSKLPYGIGGFSVRFATDGLSVSVIVSGFFGIGYLPGDFPVVPLRFVRDALGLRQPEAVLGEFQGESIYEWTMPIYLPALMLLARGSNHQAVVNLGAQLGIAKGTVDSVLIREFDTLRLIAPADEAALAARDLPMEQAALTQIPVEVLEARERSTRYREIDQTMLAGKTGRAIEMLTTALQQDRASIYLRRRLALLGLCGLRDKLPEFIAGGLGVEPEHEVFVSYAVALAVDAKVYSQALGFLSKLGSKLTRQIPGADQLKAFDVVLPELLGDAWLTEDPTKAEDCYHRIIERRGDLPRILRKLIYVARKGQRADVEVGLLNRLSRVERRKIELSKIHLRHAELRRNHETGRDEALEMALKALRLDRSEGRAAILASQLLVEKGKPDSAIQLLDGLLKDTSVALATKTRAKIFAELAGVWEHRLGRKDLAETRYEQAIQYDRSDVSVLKSLEAIYRERHDLVKLAWLLEIEFDAFESQGNAEALRSTFEELTTLYRGVLARPFRAYELYQRLVSHVSTSTDEIDQVLAWRDVDIDWRDLYNRLVVNLPKMSRGEYRAQYLCRLAQICRERLGDTSGAQRHLMTALEDGWIDPIGFRFLIETLGVSGDYATLAKCYELRAAQVGPGQRRDILLEMLQIPGVLTDERRDQVALAAYLLDTENQAVIHARFRYYQQADDIDGLRRLISLLISDLGVPSQTRTMWIKASIEAAHAFETEKRFAVMDELYRRLLDAGEDAQPILSEAITALKRSAEFDRLRYFVTRLLKIGFLPPLEERFVLRLLAGHDLDMALYHQLMSNASTRPEIAAVHARTAAALYAKRDKQEVNTEAMMARLCSLVPCAEDDLVQLGYLVGVTGNYQALARALQKQADFEDEKNRKFRLLDQLAQVYWRKLKDYGRARLTYVLAIKLAPEPTKIKLLLAQIAGDAGDAKAERKALSDFLLDVQCINDTLAMTAAIARMIKLGEDRRIVQRLVSPHIDHAMQQGQSELAGRIAQTLIDNDAASTDIYRVAFRAAVAVRNDARAKFCWWNGLASVSDRIRAKAFMAETRQLLDREGRKELLIECYQEALKQRIGDRLGPKIKREILIQYGAQLFDSDSRRDKALEIYAEAYRSDTEDNRTWMPLYFLLLEFGSPLERYRHLTEIISKLELDPRPLKAFPITIESLQAELKELEVELRDSPQAALAAMSADDVSAELPALPEGSAMDIEESSQDVSLSEAGEADDEFGDLAQLPAVAGEAAGFGTIEARIGGSASSGRVLVPMPPPLPASKSSGSRTAKAVVPEFKLDDGEEKRAPTPTTPDLAASGLGVDPSRFSSSVEIGAKAAVAAQADLAKALARFDLGSLPANQERIVVPPSGAITSPQPDSPSFDLDAIEGEAKLDSALDLGVLNAGSRKDVQPEASRESPLGAAMPNPFLRAESLAAMAPSLKNDPAMPDLALDLGFNVGVADLKSDQPSTAEAESFATNDASAVLDIGIAGAVVGPDPEIPMDFAIDLPSVPKQAPASTPDGADFGMAIDLPLIEPPLLSTPESNPAELSLGVASSQPVSDGIDEASSSSSSLDLPTPSTEPTASGSMATLAGDTGRTQNPTASMPEVRLGGRAPEPPSGFIRIGSTQAEDSQIATQADSGESGVTNRSAGLFAGIEGVQDDVSDWRAAVNKGDFNADLTKRLVTQAFASELEKHLAIQAVALVAGNCDKLNGWHWRVWRKPEEYGYRISATDRYPQDLKAEWESSELKLVVAMNPILVRCYRERFTLEFIAKKLELTASGIEKLRKPMEWNSGLLKDVGMDLLASRIQEKHFKIYNLTGLEREIFYEGAARSFYIDESYYRKVPNSHLFHRISEIMWAVHNRYYVPLALHPTKQFLPVMQELHQSLGASGFMRLKSRLGSKTRFANVFARTDLREIKALYEKTGMIKEDQIPQLWDAMMMQLHRMKIAETLDIVGVFEAILDKDLLKQGVVRHSEIYELSPVTKPLIEFVTKLKI